MSWNVWVKISRITPIALYIKSEWIETNNKIVYYFNYMVKACMNINYASDADALESSYTAPF